jgi:hypothetical protein
MQITPRYDCLASAIHAFVELEALAAELKLELLGGCLHLLFPGTEGW